MGVQLIVISILPASLTLSDSRRMEVSGHAEMNVLGDALLRFATVHIGIVIADTFPYVSGFCRVRRATNSSFPISRTTHFDKRSAISVARTCLHWKEQGIFLVAQKMKYVPSAETAISAQSKRRLGRCKNAEQRRSDAESERRRRNLSCRRQKSDADPKAKCT